MYFLKYSSHSFSFFLYMAMSRNSQSDIPHNVFSVRVDTFSFFLRRNNCPAEKLYLLISWYCEILNHYTHNETGQSIHSTLYGFL